MAGGAHRVELFGVKNQLVPSHPPVHGPFRAECGIGVAGIHHGTAAFFFLAALEITARRDRMVASIR